MGKSVIAAVICKRFAEHVGASHFFQCNNSQYNNQKFFLQSLAWHLGKAVPAYKEVLIEKLSGNLGKSNEPLPEVFVGTLFGFENPVDTKQKVAKATNVLSSLLVIEKDKSISFFHKSLRDWLVDIFDHDYSINVEYGHEIIFDLCVKELDKLMKSGVSSKCFDSTGIRYALKHCVAHMLNGVNDTEKLECSVREYIADLEVMFASVSFNVVLSTNNISSLINHELYMHVSENTRRIVNRMF
jgi:hypothetical protein